MGNITLENNSRKYQRNIKGRYLQQRKKNIGPSPAVSQTAGASQKPALWFSGARAESIFFERSK